MAGYIANAMSIAEALTSELADAFRQACEPNSRQSLEDKSNLSVRTDQNKKPPDWVHIQKAGCIFYENVLRHGLC